MSRAQMIDVYVNAVNDQHRRSRSSLVEGGERDERLALQRLVRQSENNTDRETSDFERVLVFGGVCFMIVIIFLMFRMRIPVAELFKFSPVIWLISALVYALFLRLFSYCRRLYKRRKMMRSQQDYSPYCDEDLPHLYRSSLVRLPHSCNRSVMESSASRRVHRRASSLPPAYDEIVARTPFIRNNNEKSIERRRNSSFGSASSLPPPTYEDAMRTLLNA